MSKKAFGIRSCFMKSSFKLAVFASILVCAFLAASGQTQLHPDQAEKFKVTPEQAIEFAIDLKAGELCDIAMKATGDPALYFRLIDPANKVLVKDDSLDDGH